MWGTKCGGGSVLLAVVNFFFRYYFINVLDRSVIRIGDEEEPSINKTGNADAGQV